MTTNFPEPSERIARVNIKRDIERLLKNDPPMDDITVSREGIARFHIDANFAGRKIWIQSLTGLGFLVEGTGWSLIAAWQDDNTAIRPTGFKGAEDAFLDDLTIARMFI